MKTKMAVYEVQSIVQRDFAVGRFLWLKTEWTLAVQLISLALPI